MVKTNSTKRAMLGSAIALLLCFAMLLGATFAWFTDNVTSTGNRIISGNLEIDLLMDKTEDNNYVSIADGEGDIFDETAGGNGFNWEPGKTEIVYLAVRNTGTLALKYNILLDITDGGLIGSLEYAIIDGAKAADLLGAEKWTDIKNDSRAQAGDVEAGAFTVAPNGRLDAIALTGEENETDYFALAVHMKEEAGNEYEEKDITIDIKVTATQVEAENDSFGTDYDKGLVPPVEDGEVIIENEDGVQLYYNNEDGALTLYSLENYDATSSTYTVPTGIETIGNYAFTTNADIKEVILPATVTSLGRGFDSSTVEKVVLNDGLETIDSRAFRSTTALEEVVIPSTVTTIADNAFQKSGIKEITIPASVQTLGETAFGASLIEKVTFEGSITIEAYAFRGATKLREVYLNGDDVNFVASSIRPSINSCWFCNGESNNPGASRITFYVKNNAVASKIKAVMGAERFGAEDNRIFVNGVEANYGDL